MDETEAEVLVDLADLILHPRDEIVIIDAADGPVNECTPATVALALRLRARPDLVIWAIVERWNGFRIVRELY